MNPNPNHTGLQLPGGVILNAYPDSIGTRLSDAVNMLRRPELQGTFSQFYILPTIFHSDLDRGFSIIDYDLNEELVSTGDLDDLRAMKIKLKLDLVLNHLSVNSPQFRDLLSRGRESEYSDFFIDWNKFWQGRGSTGKDGYIIPDSEYLEKLFMRKPDLPVMKVRLPDGSDRFFWNTFYQDIRESDRGTEYLGQIDLNARSEKVWAFYEETLKKLSGYGTGIVRLDAFAYLHKEPGKPNFFNRPGTFQYLERIKEIAGKYALVPLPEVHSEYGSGMHEEIALKGFPIYDFFFPGLVIDALERGTGDDLRSWITEIIEKRLKTINMLGCHDGIPVLDLKSGRSGGTHHPGLLAEEHINAITDLIIERGGRVKNLYGPDGKKISYYQVNATFFSALGEDERKLRLARAIQLFMPGTPQVWYLDLFAGKNDNAAADKAGPGGHKEINRTNLSLKDIDSGLKNPIVLDQLDMIRLRNTSPAFNGYLAVNQETKPHILQLSWLHKGYSATLYADLHDHSFHIEHRDNLDRRELFTYP